MGPKKIIAKQECETKQEVDTQVPSGKKTPVKRVAKPKQTKDTNNKSFDEKLTQITIEWNDCNSESTNVQKELEKIENKKLNLLKKLTDMLNEFKELNVDNKPSTSSKFDKNVDSTNSSESTENDTNSDEDIDIKQKTTQPKSKSKSKVGKNLTIGADSSETKPPAKSRAKAKAPQPVLNVPMTDTDDSDNE
jgi:hypothetical protein